MESIANPSSSTLGPHTLDVERFRKMYSEAEKHPEQFWSEQAHAILQFDSPWTSVLEYDFHKATIAWFKGARLNVSVNCVDRHAAATPEKIALDWEGNRVGENRSVSYRELLDLVTRAAAMLRGLGVRKGDRVAIYLPLVPEAVVAMLACARVGAVHSVVFAGFSAEALSGRMNDSGCKVLITADQAVRGEKVIPLKEIADEACKNAPSIERVLMVKRTGAEVPIVSGRDCWWDEEMSVVDALRGHPESMDSEDPLFILYTSGSTGKPKGVVHTQAGYLLYAAFTHRYVFDLRPDDVHFCTADIGWITGHSYVVYGPLCNGATTVLFEPTPVYPDPGRYWQTVDRVGATIFYTAPTAIRTLAKETLDFVKRSRRTTLRVLGTVGEPINADAWRWYFDNVGEKRCPIVDTWWQTETGGILMSAVPGVFPLKPGSASRPLPGVIPRLERADVKTSPDEAGGRMCNSKPWPGIMRTVWGDHERFISTYFSQHPGMYFTGDGCRQDSDGDYWITGRVDDVLNVSGHRLGTAEVESAIVRSEMVAEAAVVGFPHAIKGEGILGFCVLKDGADLISAQQKIRSTVRTVLSAIAVPDEIVFVNGLPKTRSGKIMRRLLRKIGASDHANLGDTSTLADPAIVSHIIERTVSARKTAPK